MSSLKRENMSGKQTRPYRDITEDSIRDLVDSFYARVRKDALLGPIFEEKIGDKWDEHLPKMYAFWSSVMLKTGRYHGRPVPRHVGIRGLNKNHFSHWLAMFHDTARELFVPECAEKFVEKSNLIAESLQIAIFRVLGMEGGFAPKPWTPDA